MDPDTALSDKQALEESKRDEIQSREVRRSLKSSPKLPRENIGASFTTWGILQEKRK